MTSFVRHRGIARALIRMAASTAVAVALAGPAQAATVFDQGPPRNDGGVRSVFWNADDFTLSSAALLTGATFYLVRDGRSPVLNYALYADAGGTPGAVLTSGTATVRTTDLGLPPFAGIASFRLESWAFDFATPIAALASVRYWIGVQQTEDIILATLDGTNPGASAVISSSMTGGFSARSPGIAFSMQAAAVTPPVGAVPEPATWAMMLVGFATAGAALRRRRAAATAIA